MIKNNCTVRLETKEDWKEVENLTREAFWNKYRPSCSEHYVLHQFRDCPDFVKELDYVIEEEGRILEGMVESAKWVKECEKCLESHGRKVKRESTML